MGLFISLLFLVSLSTYAFNCPGTNQDFEILDKQDSFLQLTKQITCVEAFNQEALTHKHSYDFSVCENGKFNLSIKTFFPNAKTVEEVFNNYFLNGDTVNTASSLLQSAPTINDKIKPTVLELSQLSTYKMKSEPVKSGSTSHLVSDCSMMITDKINKIEQNCNLNLREGTGGEVFNSGKNSTNITCEKNPADTKGVTCTIIVHGHPKPYQSFFIHRSAERLAVSGAIETMKDMFALSFINHSVNGCKPNDSDAGIAKTNFYINNVEKFWPQGVALTAAITKSNSKISLSSSTTVNKATYLNDVKECE